MSVPLRKEEPEFEQDLTTADLAQGKRPVSKDRLNEDRLNNDRFTNDRLTEDRPKPVLAARPSASTEIAPGADTDVRSTINEVRSSSTPERTASHGAPLFPNNELEGLRNRWSAVQTAFVDEPCSAVQQADGLVAAAMKRLAEVFAEETLQT